MALSGRISLLLAAVALGLCGSARGDAPVHDADKVEIGDHLFKDRNGQLLFGSRLFVWNPEWGRMPDRAYTGRVCLTERAWEQVPLQRVVDVPSFRQVDAFGSYFRDRRRIYAWAVRPTGCPLFSMPRARVRFLGTNKEFLLHAGVIYAAGERLDDEPKLDLTRLKVVRLPRTTKRGFHEFVTDGKVIFGAYFALDRSQVEHLDLRDQDKVWLIRRFSLQ